MLLLRTVYRMIIKSFHLVTSVEKKKKTRLINVIKAIITEIDYYFFCP